MGKEKFIELMKIGLKYDKQTKTFLIEKMDNIEQLKNVLSNLFKDEITFAQTCFLCDKVFPCSECEYQNICRSKDIPSYCICKKCLEKPNFSMLYLEKTRKILNLG